MKRIKQLIHAGLIVTLALALTTCGGGGGESGGGGPPQGSGGESADFNFTFTSMSSPDPATQQAAGPGPTDPNLATGNLMLVRQGPEGSAKVFDFEVVVDDTAFSINTQVVVNLDGGTYDFHFLLFRDGQPYAGSVRDRLIVSGQNLVRFVLHPVIATDAVAIAQVPDLIERQFHFDPTLIETFGEPRFGVIHNGNPESSFLINVSAAESSVTVLVPSSTVTLEFRFYDGALLKETGDEDSAPIATGITYTYNPGSDTQDPSAEFLFSIPSVIVEVGGGLYNLEAKASLVGLENPLVEQTLTLQAVGDHFEGGFTVTGFVPGDITWALEFRSLGPKGRLFAYCAQTVDLPEADASTTLSFVCYPTLVPAEEPGTEPVARLILTVSDGSPVAGAVISANNDTLGITSGGASGTEGQLETFLPANVYLVQATHQTLHQETGEPLVRSGEISVALAPGALVEQTILLGGGEPPPPEPPPPDVEPGPAVDTLTVTASREVRPRVFHDGEVVPEGSATLRLPGPEAVRVLQGDPRRYLVIVNFGKVKCWFLGGLHDGHREHDDDDDDDNHHSGGQHVRDHDDDDDDDGKDWRDYFEDWFKSPACNKGYAEGDPLTVDGPIKARVISGNPHYPITEIAVELPVQSWN